MHIAAYENYSLALVSRISSNILFCSSGKFPNIHHHRFGINLLPASNDAQFSGFINSILSSSIVLLQA